MIIVSEIFYAIQIQNYNINKLVYLSSEQKTHTAILKKIR